MDKLDFERKISVAFSGGARRVRELRLSEAEADYIRLHYLAQVRELGGAWYEITFLGGQH